MRLDYSAYVGSVSRRGTLTVNRSMPAQPLARSRNLPEHPDLSCAILARQPGFTEPKMEPSKSAMKAALRVLTALSEHQQPDAADVDELHWYAPSDRERPIDELACEAIQRALKDREQKRKAIKAQERERALALAVVSEGVLAANETISQRERQLAAGRLAREHERRRQEYLALSARLQRVGVAMQEAAANLVVAAAGPMNCEAARELLERVAGDVDVSGITQLLHEHARLTQQLALAELALKEYGGRG